MHESTARAVTQMPERLLLLQLRFDPKLGSPIVRGSVLAPPGSISVDAIAQLTQLTVLQCRINRSSASATCAALAATVPRLCELNAVGSHNSAQQDFAQESIEVWEQMKAAGLNWRIKSPAA